MTRYLLSRYIISRTALFVAIVILAIGGLLLVMGFADEVSRRVSDRYSPWNAFVFKAMGMPSEIYTFVGPMVMLGTLVAVGGMGKASELVIIQLVSRSAKGLIFRLILPGLILLPIVFAIGEWVAPSLAVKAEVYRADKRNWGLPTLEGEWYRDGQWVINTEFVGPTQNIKGLTLFELDNNQLISAKYAQTATPNANGWLLSNVRETVFNPEGVQYRQHAELQWTPTNFDADLIEILAQDTNKLTLSQLMTQVNFSYEQNLQQGDLSLTFWNRVWFPIEYLGMLFLALAFSMGSFRQRTLGDTAFRALALAIAAQLLIDTTASVGLVLNLAPWLAALLPHLLFMCLAAWQLKRKL